MKTLVTVFFAYARKVSNLCTILSLSTIAAGKQKVNKKKICYSKLSKANGVGVSYTNREKFSSN